MISILCGYANRAFERKGHLGNMVDHHDAQNHSFKLQVSDMDRKYDIFKAMMGSIQNYTINSHYLMSDKNNLNPANIQEKIVFLDATVFVYIWSGVISDIIDRHPASTG